MTVAWPDYELLDFGDGRKLERFGSYIYDRPCPAAIALPKLHASEWRKRHSRYNGDRVGGGRWEPELADERFEFDQLPWCTVPVDGGFKLFAVPRPGGQIGIFPEQFANWKWIAEQVRRSPAPVRVLNLFAYTGGSTLAAAAAGAAVTHVDAAKPSIERASWNAHGSGFDEHPIRWIVEDAVKFCRREVKRGNRYDAIILDPPTYGHGPKGEEWIIKRDLLPLLELCGELTDRRPKFLLLTCHSPGIGQAELSAYLSEGIFGACGQPPRTLELSLTTADNRRLPSGLAARWPG